MVGSSTVKELLQIFNQDTQISLSGSETQKNMKQVLNCDTEKQEASLRLSFLLRDSMVSKEAA